MTIRRKPGAPFKEFLLKAGAVWAVYWQYMVFTIAVTIIIGVFIPLTAMALLFTLILPILILCLWGQALDKELQWTDREGL